MNDDFTGSEVFAMSQLLQGAYRCNHRNSRGNREYDHYTVSGLDGIAKGWNRKTIRKVIEFLRRESLINIHKEYSQTVDNEHNTGFEITLTQKGIQLAAAPGWHAFSDFYRSNKNERYEKELAIREKKANIYNPILNLIVSTVVSALVSLYIFYEGNKTTKQEGQRFYNDSLQRELTGLKRRVDSLSIIRERATTGSEHRTRKKG